eukprot:SAG11_NODE_1002_length_6214_cov_2.976124_5_plen_164_part_00
MWLANFVCSCILSIARISGIHRHLSRKDGDKHAVDVTNKHEIGLRMKEIVSVCDGIHRESAAWEHSTANALFLFSAATAVFIVIAYESAAYCTPNKIGEHRAYQKYVAQFMAIIFGTFIPGTLIFPALLTQACDQVCFFFLLGCGACLAPAEIRTWCGQTVDR